MFHTRCHISAGNRAGIGSGNVVAEGIAHGARGKKEGEKEGKRKPVVESSKLKADERR